MILWRLRRLQRWAGLGPIALVYDANHRRRDGGSGQYVVFECSTGGGYDTQWWLGDGPTPAAAIRSVRAGVRERLAREVARARAGDTDG